MGKREKVKIYYHILQRYWIQWCGSFQFDIYLRMNIAGGAQILKYITVCCFARLHIRLVRQGCEMLQAYRALARSGKDKWKRIPYICNPISIPISWKTCGLELIYLLEFISSNYKHNNIYVKRINVFEYKVLKMVQTTLFLEKEISALQEREITVSLFRHNKKL